LEQSVRLRLRILLGTGTLGAASCHSNSEQNPQGKNDEFPHATKPSTLVPELNPVDYALLAVRCPPDALTFNFSTTSLRIRSSGLPGNFISKSNRLMANSAFRFTASSATCTWAGKEICLVIPCRVKFPVITVLVPLSATEVVSNVAVGICATLKKSGVFKCPVNRSVSVQIEVVSITTLLPEFAKCPSTTASCPSNFLNPPRWLPVTLEPTNSTLEPSGVMAYVRVAAAGALAVSIEFVFETVAAGTLSAGFEQPQASA